MTLKTTKADVESAIVNGMDGKGEGANAWALVGSLHRSVDYEGESIQAVWCVGVFMDPYEAQAKLNEIRQHVREDPVMTKMPSHEWTVVGTPKNGRYGYPDQNNVEPENEPILRVDPRCIIALRTSCWMEQSGDDRYFSYEVLPTNVLGHARGPL